MITLVLTNRNRDIRIIKNCLDSLQNQSDIDFEWFLVDYGSNESYLSELNALVLQYPQIQFISCPTSGQLWNKSRAINIVLNQCKTPFFFVGDIDMIFHPNFISELKGLTSIDKATYFQVGFLSQEESLKKITFDKYDIAFKSNKEATGMTLYPTAILRLINGYDEFYHGWGAEDTDVHIRLTNKGFKVQFYDEKILIKHQWHLKKYRSKASLEPFHSHLEMINHQYIKHAQNFQIIEANKNHQFGLMPIDSEYKKLEEIKNTYQVFSEVSEIDSFLNGTLNNLPQGIYQIDFMIHPLYNDLKNKIKCLIGKKAYKFYSLEEINDKLLFTIILNFRNNPYKSTFDREKETLSLKIVINS